MIFELTDTAKAEHLFTGMQDSLIWSCLQKVMGKIYVTDPNSPRAAMAFLHVFAFCAGEPDRELIENKPEGYVIMVPQNESWAELILSCFPKAERLTRYAIKKGAKFDRERLESLAAALPAGYEIKNIDDELHDMCLAEPLFKDFVSVFGSKDRFLELGRGKVILKDGKIVSGASSFSVYREGIEIEVDTLEEERRKGLATAASAALILSCLEDGLYPSWDAANMASVHLAEKLGYEFSREYTCYGIH